MIVFPDAETVVMGWISGTVATSVPNPRPAEFVRVIRTGGTRQTTATDAAQITIESFAQTETAAERKLAEIRADIFERANGRDARAVEELSGPANLPDPLTGQPRYIQTFIIHLKGVTA